MSSLSPIVELLGSAGVVSLLILASFGFGRPLHRWTQPGESDALATGVWSISLGLVVAAVWMLVLATFGWMYPSVAWLVTLAAAQWALVEICGLGSEPWHRMRHGLATGALRSCSFGTGAVVSLACVVALLSLIAACAPPTSADVLSRSLAIPKNVLVTHGLDPELAAPNLAQAWSLWALALDSPVAANLLHWGLGVLLALATALLARPILGSSAAVVAGCLVIFSPGVERYLGLPLEQVPLALAATLAIAGFIEALTRCDTGRMALAAGGMLGAAAAIRTEGICLAAALALLGGYEAWRLPEVRARSLAVTGQCLLAAVLVAAPWWLCVGMPSLDAKVTVDGGFAALGPLLSIALGGMVFARRLWGMNRIGFVLVTYAELVVLGIGPAIWWPVVIPLASVIAAWVWHESHRLPPVARWLAAGACLLLLVAGMEHGASRAWQALAVATGRQSRHEFLLRREPTYRAASLLNQIGRSEQSLLSQDARGLYFACLTVPSAVLDKNSDRVLTAMEQRELVRSARSQGFTYLLLAEPVTDTGVVWQASDACTTGDPGHDLDSDQLDATRKVIPILEYSFADDKNRSIRYRLLKLPEPRFSPHRLSAIDGESAARPPRFPTR